MCREIISPTLRIGVRSDFLTQVSQRFMPVRNYSSGMSVRLGFAVAVLGLPEILLVDEVLAVGDINFQKKCFERIDAIKREGTTIILVSHGVPGPGQGRGRICLGSDAETVSGLVQRTSSSIRDRLRKLEFTRFCGDFLT